MVAPAPPRPYPPRTYSTLPVLEDLSRQVGWVELPTRKGRLTVLWGEDGWLYRLNASPVTYDQAADALRVG